MRAQNGGSFLRSSIIGLTVGDPAGVGPEILLKGLLQTDLWKDSIPLVIGDMTVMEEAIKQFNYGVSFRPWLPGQTIEANHERKVFSIYDTKTGYPMPPMGKASITGGRISLESLMAATRLALAKEIDAIVTLPICKESFSLAGCNSNGHTDLLAKLTNTSDYAMMLATNDLQVVHVTTHLSLAEACKKINRRVMLEKIRLSARTASQLNPDHPVVAVCALNPHAGENGLMGREEIETIIPAIDDARAEGLPVVGPFPADTVFLRAQNGEFHMVLALYHDQDHIPIKLLGFMDGVNVTLGLPFVRTSVEWNCFW